MAVLTLGKREATRDDLEWRAIARLLWFHRWMVLAAAVIGGLGAFLFFAGQDRLYEATALVEVNLEEEQIIAIAERQTEDGAEQGNMEDVIVLLTSNAFLNALSDRLNLQDDAEFFSAAHHNDGQDVKQQAAAAVNTDRAADHLHIKATIAANLVDHLQVSQIGGSHVVAITASSISPVKAARIANGMATLYLEHQRDGRASQTTEAVEALAERIKGLRGELAGLEGQIVAYKVNHGIEDFDDEQAESSSVAVQRSELTTQLALVKAGIAEAEARSRQFAGQFENATNRSIPATLTSPVLRELRTTETDILRRQSQLAGEYGTQHPAMVSLVDELGIVRARMENEVAKIRQNLRNDVSVNLARAAELESQLALLSAKSTTQQQAHVGLMDLQQRSQASRELLNDMLARHQLLLQTQNLDTARARIMSPAAIPTKAVYPKTGFFSFLAALVVLSSACLGIFLHERWTADFGFTTLDQLREFELTPLGVVPNLKEREAEGQTVEDYALRHAQAAQSEAIQRIRTKLQPLNGDSAQPGQVLLVTSSLPLEGKTSISVILARQAAAAGVQTLLIDGDLRRPRVHDALHIENAAGLAQILTGEGADHDLIREDPLTPLSFLSAGHLNASPADLFRSARMNSLMAQLRHYFDWIVIDSPPVGAVVDSLVLSTHADACVFVARWRETTRSTILSSVRQLRDVQAPLAGVVLSRVDVSTQAKYGDVDFGQHYGRYHDHRPSSARPMAELRPKAA